jgi:hypothetical protein
LCAYYEVFLIKIAQKEANERNGQLTYLYHDNEKGLIPENRPQTKGGDNTDIRNETHTLQNLRRSKKCLKKSQNV